MTTDAVANVVAEIEAFKRRQSAGLEAATERIDKLEMVLNRPSWGGGGRSADVGRNGESVRTTPREMWRDAKTGASVPVLAHGDRLASAVDASNEPAMPLGRFLRGIVLGGRAPDHREFFDRLGNMTIGTDPGGGYTVGGVVAVEWIDRLRAASVLSRAGCRTVPMPAGEMQIARVLTDPEIGWHAEGAELSASQPTLGAVTLRAKTVACLVKFSVELAQDSVNIEELLAGVLTSSMASAIDSAGLVGVTVDAGAAPGGLFDLSGRNSVTGVGAPTSWDWAIDGMHELALDNVPLEEIGALVAHPSVWKTMRKLKTGLSGDNTPLTMPDEVARLPKLWTTAAPLDGGTAKAIMGRWPDLLMGVRQQLTLKVLSERFLGDTLEIGMLAWARVDFAATRPASFCTIEGITV